MRSHVCEEEREEITAQKREDARAAACAAHNSAQWYKERRARRRAAEKHITDYRKLYAFFMDFAEDCTAGMLPLPNSEDAALLSEAWRLTHPDRSSSSDVSCLRGTVHSLHLHPVFVLGCSSTRVRFVACPAQRSSDLTRAAYVTKLLHSLLCLMAVVAETTTTTLISIIFTYV